MEIKTSKEIELSNRQNQFDDTKWVSLKSIKSHFRGCGRDPEGSLVLFLKELENE